MNTHTNSYLAKSMWVAALTIITWQQTTAAQHVVTQFPLRVEQPTRSAPNNPVPKGARILILANSPVTTEAQRKYDQGVAGAVQNCWFTLLKNFEAPVSFAGTNVTEFELSFDGSVKRLACVQKSGSKDLDTISASAIRMPAPFGRHDQGRDEPRKFRVAFLLPENK